MAFPYVDIIIRSTAVYFFILFALRIFGKQELSQLNIADVILILLISNSVQNAMVGPDTSLWGGLAAATVLFSINFIVRKIIFRYKGLGSLLEDKAIILVHNGKPDFKALAHLSISSSEMEEAMREHGIGHYSEIKLAMLETDGNISIISNGKEMKETYFSRTKHAGQKKGSKNEKRDSI